MKILLLSIYSLLCCALSAGDSKIFQTEITESGNLIAATALYKFLENYKPSGNEKTIYYLQVKGADAAWVVEYIASKIYIHLTIGDAYEIRDRQYIDKKTGNPCESIVVRIESIDPDKGVAIVEWATSTMGMEGIAYQMKKDDGKWIVIKILGRAAS